MFIHYDTPRRVKVQKVYEFMFAQNIFFDSRDIFQQFDVSNTVNYELIKNGAFFRRNHSCTSRFYKIKPEQMRETDQILQNDSLTLKEKRLT